MELFVQYLFDALSIGGIYALVALGLALLFSVMGLVNFAYGEFIMVGGYTLLAVRDLPWVLAITITLLVVVIVSLLTDLVAFRPLRGAELSTLMITSFGISFGLQNLIRMIAGSRARGLDIPTELAEVFTIGGIRIPRMQIVIAIVTALLLTCLALLLKKTTLGIQLRAAAEDFEMARLLGVRASWTIASAFAITGLIAGVVSLLLVARTGAVFPSMGLEPLLIAFVAVVLGGLGSLWGAVAGGLVLGLVTGFLQALLPVDLAPYRTAFLFGVVVLVLLVRGQGLFGRARVQV